MEEISRWSPDSDELTSCHPSRPSTPQSVRALLRSRGSPLRTLGKKLSSTGLSVRSRKASPGRGADTRLNESHVSGSDGEVVSVVNRRSPSLRPLSIAVGRPFQLDVNRALDFVQTSLSPSLRETSSKEPVKRQLLPPAAPPTTMPARPSTMSTPDPTRRHAGSSSASPPEGFAADRAEVPKQKEIRGDFRTLSRLPPPDLGQHPAMQVDPLNTTSDAPLLVTDSKKEEIKRMVKEARRKFDEKERQMEREEAEQEEAERLGTVRFKSFPKRGNAFAAAYNKAAGADANLFTPVTHSPGNMERTLLPIAASISGRAAIAGRQSLRQVSEPDSTFDFRHDFSRLQIDKDNEQTDIYDILKEGSPVLAATPCLANSSIDSEKLFTTPASDGIEQKKSGIRKVTGKFSKPKSDKSPSEVTSPKEIDMFHRPDLERYLRAVTNNHSYDYEQGQPFPRHPNTSRAWHSRNLKCTNCLDQCCAVCGRACCAYKAASLALDLHRGSSDSLKAAEERLLQIAFLFPYGKEVPTFLQCTKGGDIGCGKMVCPDCCGECPDPICKDIQCRKCKKEPWNECWWHDGDMRMRELSAQKDEDKA